MKKIFKLGVLFVVVFGLFIITGCDKKEKKEETKKESYVVTFDSKDGSKVESITVKCDETLKLPENPTKSGYNFITWEDKNGTPIYNDALLTCDDVTLYAVWSEL